VSFRRRDRPAIIETAAAIAPEAPAISTVLVSLVVAATPKIRPKMETVPSSIPKTIVPAELMNELRIRCRIEFVRIPSVRTDGRNSAAKEIFAVKYLTAMTAKTPSKNKHTCSRAIDRDRRKSRA
jgi:hypothetical protein